MPTDILAELFGPTTCDTILPRTRSNEFFEAMFGDADEGAYDIILHYAGSDNDSLRFNLELHQRPGQCLACNLTYGLPEVFSRHPIINLGGLVEKIDAILGDRGTTGSFKLGATVPNSDSMHTIPLTIELQRR